MEKTKIKCAKCSDEGYYELNGVFIVPCECEAGKEFQKRKSGEKIGGCFE